MLPPERVIFPDADPKVMAPELTLPDTVIVPAARPSVDVPKFSELDVVVVVVPESAEVPNELVLQPWVASLVVGAAQVPAAVPNPAVASLLSQYKVWAQLAFVKQSTEHKVSSGIHFLFVLFMAFSPVNAFGWGLKGICFPAPLGG